MNFVELISDLQLSLRSPHYVDSLWSKLREEPISLAATLEDHELYRNHLPLDLKKCLKHSVSKLREMKHVTDENSWENLDEKYISTFIYFVLEEEDVNLDNALYAANMFVLLNVIPIPDKQLFYKVTYLKILNILNEYNNSGDIIDNTVIFLMDDFKTMLSNISIPDETVTSTIAVLHAFTYSCNEEFQQINTDISFENLGYIAFVSLKILAEKLVHQKKEKDLYPIILSLMSSLKSAPISNLQGNVKKVHQKNVILFLKDNINVFCTRNSCLITDALKTICLSSEYDDNQGIAELVQQLPAEMNQTFFEFFVEAMVCTRDDFKKNCLDLVIPLLRSPADYETISKKLIKAEIVLTNVIMLFADKNEDVRTRALKSVAEYSEDTLGRRVLRKMMGPDNFTDINKNSIQDILYQIIDPSWSKKKLNTSYIQLICNLFIIRKDLVTIKALNRLRNICLKGSPFDLKPCIINLKRLLEHHSGEHDVLMYILSIFTKQMFHPMSTSSVFAKELSDLIFSNITVNEEENFIWNIINHLISHNFPVHSVFEKFNSLGLLQDKHVRILMEYKIQESTCRTPALKLLCIMLNFVRYNKTHLLEEILEDWIITQIPQLENLQRMQPKRTGNQINLSPTDLSLVIYSLTKIMERKRRTDCSNSDLQNFRQMHHLICRAFFEQVFPVNTVNYVIVLLSIYAGLIEEDVYWDSSACVSFEEELRNKLTDLCNTVLENHIYLLRDVIYIGELLLLKKTTLNTATFNLLKRIATASEHTRNFSVYLKNHEEIWSLCIMLYVKACFIDKHLVEDCAENLVFILSNLQISEYTKLQILYALYDICAMHFEYFDPVVPFLFNLLNDKNDYVRFISSKIIMKLVQEEHLRLMDGQYYVFMSLLADQNDIISQNVELFVKECFVKKFPQTIAGSFIPSIVHYNFCYTYPGISLLESDRDLLKVKRCTLSNRSNIYYCLFQYLPTSIQFNVLHQISSEILAKFLSNKLSNISEASDIFEDALSVILLIVPKEKISQITSHYFDEEIKLIPGLLSYVESTGKTPENKAEKTALRSLCFNLIRILYSDHNKDSKVCQNVLFVISLLRKNFESLIKQVLHEDSHLKDLFSNLKKFYHKTKDQFQNSHVTVFPQHSSILGDDTTEFYWRELVDFTFIHPCKIIGITDS